MHEGKERSIENETWKYTGNCQFRVVKSTLINAVLGENLVKTGSGISGTTSELKIYESGKIPFRIIDTIGFEPSWMKEMEAIRAVRKWSKDSAKEGNKDTQINVIGSVSMVLHESFSHRQSRICPVLLLCGNLFR